MDKFEDFLNSDEIKNYRESYNDSYIDFNKIFSINELEIIFNSIDKTDFTHMGVSRWFDLNSILEQITNTKKLHTKAILSKMTHSVVHETWPPCNKYYYHYIFSD